MHRSRGWLVQFHPENAAEAVLGFIDQGIVVTYPAVRRHLDQVAVGDAVVFWVTGGANRSTSGVYGFGQVAGPVQELDHPVNYRDECGPWTQRPSLPVKITRMFEHVVVPRTGLVGHPGFADFELFRMANRPNLFEVSAAQLAELHRLADAPQAAD